MNTNLVSAKGQPVGAGLPAKGPGLANLSID